MLRVKEKILRRVTMATHPR